jgi:hypothetical protein
MILLNKTWATGAMPLERWGEFELVLQQTGRLHRGTRMARIRLEGSIDLCRLAISISL